MSENKEKKDQFVIAYLNNLDYTDSCMEQFKEWVLHIQLYRQDTEAGKLEKKRRAAELRQIKARRTAFGAL